MILVPSLAGKSEAIFLTVNLLLTPAPVSNNGICKSCSLGVGSDQSGTLSVQDHPAAVDTGRRVNPQTAAFRASFAQAAAAAAQADLVSCPDIVGGVLLLYRRLKTMSEGT